MVEISKCKEPCFAQTYASCEVLTGECEGRENCVFYKPASCRDWIKKRIRGKVYIVPPEEYYGEKVKYYENL